MCVSYQLTLGVQLLLQLCVCVSLCFCLSRQRSVCLLLLVESSHCGHLLSLQPAQLWLAAVHLPLQTLQLLWSQPPTIKTRVCVCKTKILLVWRCSRVCMKWCTGVEALVGVSSLLQGDWQVVQPVQSPEVIEQEEAGVRQRGGGVSWHRKLRQATQRTQPGHLVQLQASTHTPVQR